ncbi:MAG TPA: hypothetical protein VGH91_04555 [Gammaproteobacteria bacterium]
MSGKDVKRPNPQRINKQWGRRLQRQRDDTLKLPSGAAYLRDEHGTLRRVKPA